MKNQKSYGNSVECPHEDDLLTSPQATLGTYEPMSLTSMARAVRIA